MDDGLAQRDGCAAAVVAHRIIAIGIMKRWWQQHISDFDGGATREPDLDHRGENLGLTGAGYT